MKSWSKGFQAAAIIGAVLAFVLGGVIGLLGAVLVIYGVTLLPRNVEPSVTVAPAPGSAVRAYIVIGVGSAILLVGIFGKFLF